MFANSIQYLSGLSVGGVNANSGKQLSDLSSCCAAQKEMIFVNELWLHVQDSFSVFSCGISLQQQEKVSSQMQVCHEC